MNFHHFLSSGDEIVHTTYKCIMQLRWNQFNKLFHKSSEKVAYIRKSLYELGKREKIKKRSSCTNCKYFPFIFMVMLCCYVSYHALMPMWRIKYPSKQSHTHFHSHTYPIRIEEFSSSSSFPLRSCTVVVVVVLVVVMRVELMKIKDYNEYFINILYFYFIPFRFVSHTPPFPFPT